MAAQTKPPKELRNGREREDEGADRRGVALWRSAFRFFVEAFAAYAASMHPSTLRDSGQRSPELVELVTRKHPERPDAISVRLASQRERQA
jgi:hypothetical protein